MSWALDLDSAYPYSPPVYFPKLVIHRTRNIHITLHILICHSASDLIKSKYTT